MVLKITFRELLVILCVISVPLSFTNPVDLIDLSFEKDQIEFDKLFKESETNVFPIGNMPGQVLVAGCECKNGKCEQQGEKKVCVCAPEFGHLSGSYCKACNCGIGINCTFEHYYVTETICLCPDGSTVRDGKCKDVCKENNPCKNLGLCKVESSTVKCECKSSFSGEFCEKAVTCEDLQCDVSTTDCDSSTQQCKCKEGLKMADGIDNKCFLETCAERQCDVSTTVCDNSAQQCKCKEGLKMADGIKNKCFTDTCEELQCDTSTTDCDKSAQQCKCKDGLKQADGIKNKCFIKTCDELNCDLSTSVCDLEKANCKCKSGYEEDPSNKSRCINPCQRNATFCGLESGAVCYYAEDAREVLCLCKKGSLVYNEEKRKCGKICTKDNDCLNNGYCKKIGEFGFCHCPETFMGDYCEINILCEALESTCSRKGAICRIVHNRAVCQCPANQTYNALSESCEDICFSNSCDQGKCIPKGNQYMCKCFDGYTGRLCNEKQKQERDGDQHLWNISISTILIFMLFLLLTNTYYHCRRK